MKNIIVVAGVLIVLGVLAFLFGSQKAAAPATEDGVTVEETVTETKADVAVDTSGEEAPAEESAEPVPGPVGGGTSGSASAQTTTPKPVVTTPKPAASLYGALVTWTDGGFKPNRVTIKKGQTVRFLNQSSEYDMWVASAIHPLHSAYQEKSTNDCFGSTFDQCEAVEKGEYWDFTFDLVGSWEFHNHVRPNETGEITVVAE